MSVETYYRDAEVIPLARPKLTETEILIREANHRVANSLAGIAGLVRLQANEAGRRRGAFEPAEVRDMLRDAAARIEAIGRLHRLLSHQADTAHVDLGPHLEEVAGIVAAAFGQVSLETACERRLPLAAARAGTLSLILSELITNAAKHARPAGGPVAIRFACRRGDGRILVSVADDGHGLPVGFDPEAASGVGMRVLKALADQAEAELAFESGPGGLAVTVALRP